MLHPHEEPLPTRGDYMLDPYEQLLVIPQGDYMSDYMKVLLSPLEAITCWILTKDSLLPPKEIHNESS